jgi:hypothetical protein
MNHLLAVADDQHSNLKSQLADNYASAGRYLLALIEYRKSQLRERNAGHERIRAAPDGLGKKPPNAYVSGRVVRRTNDQSSPTGD